MHWRRHSEAQVEALNGRLEEIGYADALLVRELPDGRFMLIDGHLGAVTTPDVTVPVLVLDLDEAEAEKLLLTLDPLASLAERDGERIKSLPETVQTGSQAVEALLAGIRYELESHGKMRIESKEKARQRRIASPDRADALMLALAKLIESLSHPWIQQNSAVRRFQTGRTVESIAEALEATPDEVRAWLRDAARSGVYRRLGLKLCNRCGECIGFNVEYNRSSDNYSHVKCP